MQENQPCRRQLLGRILTGLCALFAAGRSAVVPPPSGPVPAPLPPPPVAPCGPGTVTSYDALGRVVSVRKVPARAVPPYGTPGVTYFSCD